MSKRNVVGSVGSLFQRESWRSFQLITSLLIIFCCACPATRAQDDTLPPKKGIPAQKDVNDILRAILKKEPKPKPDHKAAITLLPMLGYNPSFGFNIGVNMMAGKQFGLKSNTIYSVFNVSASYSTKQIATLRARHNMFTPENKWNWQGDWQLSAMGIVDYGTGTGQGKNIRQGFYFDDLPTRNSDSAFPIKYNYVQLFEKVYRKVAKHLFVGAGVDFDIYTAIDDKRLADGRATPHERYSERNGFDQKSYSANGFLLGVQYNNREHPVRSYSGIYADVNVRFNQSWMGSSKNATQLIYDFREYISLGKQSPDHVLAFWEWGSYKLSGEIPYLEMPGTAHDTYQRSGRGYTFGRFKGPSYLCFETEYRFPILANRLVSGVCFFNFQTASDDHFKDVLDYWELAGGAGLRVLFDKKSRSALCLDFAQGRYGSWGIFCGLNEVF